ncbi:hypothetical protein PSI9734_02231 [Pseudidiomarina piscicola]|uniref:Uncharacterized protein n=1 Tax=Pseudidiomarina piscicola TaxID=2614830 RepID=A0A6S6WVT5_9GAMM|nr:hypothetical protein [Pseudidiomarina piscicola]CAB0151871.1 hypothetical protein PSI9734_02231 [Pseudidiomarina piscicola]VZT41317.1 hypothetical protein PSI9734_02231 [Pseudomonas aeruginosa]
MNIEAILQDPAAVYDKPTDLLKDSRLSDEQKLKVLEQWEYDAEELLVATEENMPGPEDTQLDDILAAKQQLKDA